jgi:hypothetical protein
MAGVCGGEDLLREAIATEALQTARGAVSHAFLELVKP